MNTKLKAFIVSILVAAILAGVGVAIYCSWNAIVGTINKSKYYTSEDIQGAYDKGYDDGISNETELNAKIQYFSELVDSYYLTITELQEQNSDLQKSNESLKSTVSSLTELKEKNEADIESLQEKIEANNKTINNNESQIQELEKQVALLTSEVTDNEKEIARLKNTIQSLQTLNDNLQAVNESNLNTIAILNNQVVSLNSQISELTLQIQNNSSSVSSLNAKIAELEKSIKYYEEYIASMESGEQVVATFEFNGSVYNIQVVSKNSKLSVVDPESTDRVIFNGWTVKGQPVDLSSYTITENTKFVADVTIKYQVIFMADDEPKKTEFIVSGSTASAPSVSKDGYDFDGWTVDGESIVDLSSYEITSDVTFTAVFTKLHEVKFMYEDSTLSTQKVRNGSCAQSVSVESTDYKIFNGWKINNAFADIESYKIYTDSVFIADITYKYDVVFKVDDQQHDKQLVEKNNYAIAPANPTKDGSFFKGWSIDGETIISLHNYPITSNTTFIAVFEVDKAGLYGDNGNLIKSWKELKDEDYLKVSSDGVLSRGANEDIINLSGNLTLSLEVKEITKVEKSAEGVFNNCSGLKSITIPDSVISIGNYAFYRCSNLTTITIPESVTSIGSFAFYYCDALTSYNYSGTAEQWTQIKFIDSAANPISKVKKFMIGGQEVTAVELKNITKINYFAFYHAENITSITMSNDLTEIGEGAFYYCYGLRNVTLSSNLKTIGKSAFRSCTALVNFELPSSLSTIDDYAFLGCTNLTSITIPNQITQINKSVFSNCTGLTFVSIPASIKLIGSSAFEKCSALTSFNFLGTVSEWAKITFKGYTSNPTNFTKKLFIQGEEITNLVLDSSVETISGYAFYYCSGITSVTLPASLKKVETSAFRYCTGITYMNFLGTIDQWAQVSFGAETTSPLYYTHQLNIQGKAVSSVVLSDAVTKIGDYAFYYATNLTSITLPKTLTQIGDFAFGQCKELTSMNYLGTINDWAKIIFNKDTSNPTYYTQKLVIKGSEVRDVVISDENITEIGNNTFYNCRNIETVYISSLVTRIGTYAFYRCIGLTSITLPATLKSIDSVAFEFCNSLTSMNFLGTVDDWAQINFKTSESNPTYYTKRLTIRGSDANNIVLSNNVKYINDYAFYNCQNIISVVVGSNVETIGIMAFERCTNMTTLTIRSSVLTTIKTNAFEACSKLKYLYIPASVTTIQAARYSSGLFACTGMIAVYCGASGPQPGWGQYWNCYGSVDGSSNLGYIPVYYNYTYEQYIKATGG